MKEFKEILKKEKHPFIMEQTLSNIYNIIFVLTMLSLLFLQINNIITGSIGAIGIIILLITAIPMWTLEVKRDNRLKSMKDHYTKKKTISKVKNNLNLIKTLLIIEIISFLGLSGYILAECVFKNEMPIINYQEPYKITIKEEEVVELERYNFDNDNFSFIVPSSFTAMDKDTIKRKYPHGNPPSLVLSNEKTNINILLGATDSELKNNQVKGYVKAMKKN